MAYGSAKMAATGRGEGILNVVSIVQPTKYVNKRHVPHFSEAIAGEGVYECLVSYGTLFGDPVSLHPF